MRKLLALPFGLILAALLLAAGAAVVLRSSALEPGFYTAALRARGVFAAAESDPQKYVDLSGALAQLDALPAGTQRAVVAAALPPGWLEQAVEAGVAALTGWLASDESPPPPLPIDLRPIKDRLQGPPGQAIARDMVAAVPDCAPGQSVSITFDRLPECLPVGFDRGLVIDQVAAALNTAGGALPDMADAGRFLIRGDAAATLVQVRQWLRPATSATALAGVIAVAAGAGLIGAWLGGRTRKARLMWLGGWLLLAAILAAALAAVALVGGSRSILLGEALILPAPLTPLASDAVRSVAAQAVQQVAIRLMLLAAGTLLAGAVLVIAGISSRAERNYRRA